MERTQQEKPQTAGRCPSGSSRLLHIIFIFIFFPPRRRFRKQETLPDTRRSVLSSCINSVPTLASPARLPASRFLALLPEASSPHHSPLSQSARVPVSLPPFLPTQLRSQHNDSYPWPHMIFLSPSVFFFSCRSIDSCRGFSFRLCQILFPFDIFCCKVEVEPVCFG